MKIIFMGTPEIAVTALEKLIDSDHEILAVVTQPDRRRGRGKKISYSPVKEIALKYGINVLQPEKARDPEFIEKLKSLEPDLIVVEAYGQILNKELLDIPKKGCINIHVSLLPKYRGAAPINWAIINGEKETGVSIMYMDEGLDTGDVIEAESFKITDDMTAGDLHDIMMEKGANLMIKVVDDIDRGLAKATKQDHSLHSYAPMMDKYTGHLDFNKSAQDLHNLVRGVNPWPSAWVRLADKNIKVWKTKALEKQSNEKAGTILRVDRDGIEVACSKGILLLEEIQLPGKRNMPVGEFIKGNKINVGEIFE